MWKAQRLEVPSGLLWADCVAGLLGEGGICCEGQMGSQEGFKQNDLMKAEC